MAKKLLVPVMPSDRFYDSVVAAGDLVAREGGLITFLFTELRPSDAAYAEDPDGHPSEIDIAVEAGGADPSDVEEWRARQISGLEDARQMLYERGVNDDHIDYVFADFADDESAAQAIADEAAAGAYDLVVLSRGYLIDQVEEQGSSPTEILEAIKQSVGDEVGVMVT